MKTLFWRAGLVALACQFMATAALAQTATLANETPAHFSDKTDSWDYVRRDVMIPMRDGTKLFTVILIPKGAAHAPIILSRTPYGASSRFSKNHSAHLADVIDSDPARDATLDGGYIRVVQDIRGKHGSEGDYVMNRPLKGPLNPTEVDHATDTYDTIDWLVKNVPETNGKVGIIGISYDGFTSLMALFHPHPALKAAIPINSMVDGWRGDDWFHNGAFRQDSLAYAQSQQATRGSDIGWWSDEYDSYTDWLETGSAGDMAKKHGLDDIGFVQKLIAHPAYDSFWQEQAVDKLLAKEGLKVPTMLVHSLWDQEDIYGNMAVYKALKEKGSNPNLYLVMGPWYHHQQRLDGSSIGAIKWGSDTALYFRTHLVKPFFDHFLKDEAPAMTIAPVTAFESGTNEWHDLKSWPQGCASGCSIEQKPLYLTRKGGLSFQAPAASQPGYEDYVSDPAKPVPFIPRPVNISGENGKNWQHWLVSDQRDAASRTDVLVFSSDVLTAPMKIAGEPIANLIASTTGTDGDFVVKLIDVYPAEDGYQPEMGGYELMVAADIFRGRYRDSLSTPSAIPANQPTRFRFALPNANHVFLPGHKIMVQVQSSWFPLYDRNPQTYVDNIFLAQPQDYQKATIKVFDAGDKASFVELPVVKSSK
jgi:putative CocE/NonD family hydrolase